MKRDTKRWSCRVLAVPAALALCILLLTGCGAGKSAAAEPDPMALLARLTLELRTDTHWGAYDETLGGSLGGVPLLDESEATRGGIALLTDAVPEYAADGTLAAVTGWPGEGSWDDFSPLPAPGGVPCVAALHRDEAGAERWYAFYLPEPDGPLYAVWLDAARYPWDDFEAFALSANFAAAE